MIGKKNTLISSKKTIESEQTKDNNFKTLKNNKKK